MAAFVSALALIIATTLIGRYKAMHCIIGQEPDPASHHNHRWIIPVEEPCLCTQVHVGGRMNYAPHRPFKASYYDSFLHSDDVLEIRAFLNCTGTFVCTAEKPLGMEDGRIPDDSLTASSTWKNRTDYGPVMARLNNRVYAGAWSNSGLRIDPNPWIQVDFKTKVHVTAIITQGRLYISQWVKEYQVTKSDDGQAWEFMYMNTVNGTTAKFPGNNDTYSLVINRFNSVVYTRFLRILPTNWYRFCSMRFEVIGCYQSQCDYIRG